MEEKIEIGSKELKELKKSLRITRICCLFSCLFTAGLLVAFIFVLIQIAPALAVVDMAVPAIENVSKLDMKAANEALGIFNREASKIDWSRISEIANELDVDSINEAVAKLDVEELNRKLSALDVDAFNKAINNLNALSESLAGISKGLGLFR